MIITFNELRRIKDRLPSGSSQRIADELGIDVDTVRNYFGGKHEAKECVGVHFESGRTEAWLRWTIRRFSTLRCVFWASRNKYCMPAFGPCRRACGCAGLFFLPPDSAVLSVFVASLFALSSFLSYVFLLPARSSLCP